MLHSDMLCKTSFTCIFYVEVKQIKVLNVFEFSTPSMTKYFDKIRWILKISRKSNISLRVYLKLIHLFDELMHTSFLTPFRCSFMSRWNKIWKRHERCLVSAGELKTLWLKMFIVSEKHGLEKFYLFQRKGTLMQIWKSLYMFLVK